MGSSYWISHHSLDTIRDRFNIKSLHWNLIQCKLSPNVKQEEIYFAKFLLVAQKNFCQFCLVAEEQFMLILFSTSNIEIFLPILFSTRETLFAKLCLVAEKQFLQINFFLGDGESTFVRLEWTRCDKSENTESADIKFWSLYKIMSNNTRIEAGSRGDWYGQR